MSTVALNIQSSAYPSITNRITCRVYAQSDPLAIVASLTHDAPHLADTWSFPGLERTNYLFRFFEIDGGGAVLQQLGDDMDVVPGSAGGLEVKKTEQIIADSTTGFVSGVNSVVFDGTDGKMDWRGWEVATMDRIGQDSMKKGVDYSWDKVSATFTLLNDGDLFNAGEWFNVDFEPQATIGTDSVPTYIPAFSTPKIITGNYTIDAGTDFGGLLILKPAGNYLELTFPDLATIVAGKLCNIEFAPASVNKCAKFIFQAGQTLDWMGGERPDLYMCPQESIAIYKFIDPSGPTSMFRRFQPFGNWHRVGETVSDDNLAENVSNKVLMDGTIYDNQELARVYFDYIDKLDPSQLVNYDDWNTGNNKYKFSLANSSNPANAGKFHVADRRNLVEKNTDGTRLPGDFQAAQVGQFTDNVKINLGNSFTGNPGGDWTGLPGKGQNAPVLKSFSQTFNVGKENTVANYATRKFLLV